MSKSKRYCEAFTLIELLIVIAIIAMLVALLFPAINGVRKSARNLEAKTLANAIVIASKSYESTYGLLPITYSTDESNETLTSAQFKDLIEILSNVDYPNSGATVSSARKVKFLEVPFDYTTKGYVDPWDQEFVVAIDCNYDGDVGSFHDESNLKGKVFVYSKGSDQKDYNDGDFAKDDVVTWK